MTSARKLVQNTLYNLSAYAISALVSLVTLPLMLRFYGRSVYGVFMLASSVVGIVALLDFGLTSTLTKEIAQIEKANHDARLRSLTLWSLVWFTGIGIGTALVLLIIGNLPALFPSLTLVEFKLLHDLLVFHALAQLVMWPAKTGTVIFAGKQRYDVISLVNALLAIANALVIVFVLSIGRGPLVLVGLTVVISAVSSVALTGYALVLYRGMFAKWMFDPKFSRITAGVFSLSLPLFVAQIAAFIMQQQTDRIVLGVVLGAAAVALYEVAAKVGTLMLQMSTLLVSAFPPFVARLETMTTRKEMEQFFITTSRYLSLALVPISAILIPLAPFLIRLWVGADYLQAVRAMQLLVAAVLFYPMFCVADSILIAKGRMKTWMPFAILTALVNITLSLALVKPWGLTGVAFATFAAYLLEGVCFITITTREILTSFTRWLKKVLAPSLIAGMIAIALMEVGLHWKAPGNLMELGAQCLCVLLLTYLMVFCIMLLPRERSSLVRLLPHKVYRRIRDFYVSFRNTTSMVNRQNAIRRFVDRYLLRKKAGLYHFEIHITDHCNLNCKSCGHYCNIAPKWYATLDDFKRSVSMMASLFGSIQQMIIMGGEPLLHPQVEQFFAVARKALPDTRIHLMTNAILLPRMQPSFWQEAARNSIIIICDDYPIKLQKEKIAELAKYYGVSCEWTPTREQFFRAPLDPRRSSDPYRSLASCQGFSNCPIVRKDAEGQYRLYPCAPIAYCDILRDHFKLEAFEATERDSFILPSIPATSAQSWQALHFLLTPPPWCGHCDFDSFEYFTWGISQKRLDEWVRQ